MYYMKLECGTFTFRPLDHAVVTTEGYTWQMDAEEISRLELDAKEMFGSDTDDLAEQLSDETKRADEASAAADEADDELRDAERLIQALDKGKKMKPDTVKEVYDKIVEARNILREVI